MGTVIQFRSRQDISNSWRNRKGHEGTSPQDRAILDMSDHELIERYDHLLASDYALPAEERLRATIEIEMKRRGIVPPTMSPAPGR